MIEQQKELSFWSLKLPSADSVIVWRMLSALIENPGGLPGRDESLAQIENRKTRKPEGGQKREREGEREGERARERGGRERERGKERAREGGRERRRESEGGW